MQKIPTLFLRDESDRRHVTSTINPLCQWVINGEGTPTRKYDGTCVMLDDAGKWWARREVKLGKTPPPNYVPVTTDETTGKMMGWEPIEQSAFAKFHVEAVNWADGFSFSPGTYELIGPKVNGNPERLDGHILFEHAKAQVFYDAPRDFEGLRVWLLDHHYEGIVWHHPDGRMVKLKRRDFK